MGAIENAAFISVGRACGFAGLANLILLFSLSFDPALATRVTGIGAAIVAVTLYLYGLSARRRPYKRTETWLILGEDDRPPATVAQRVIGNTLRETSFWFAQKCVVCAVFLLGTSAVWKLV